MPGLNESPKYRAFIQNRDRALERLLNNSHARMTDYTDAALGQIESEVAVLIHRRNARSTPKDLVAQLDRNTAHVFNMLGQLIASELRVLMRRTYVLSAVGEAEAIARATGSARYDVKADSAKTPNPERIQYILNSARYGILKAFEQGLILKDDSDALMARVKKAFPERITYQRPPRELKPLKEAQRFKFEQEDFPGFENEFENARDAASGFISDADWEDMRQDYVKQYVPQFSTRAPDFKAEDERGESRYGWDLEAESNHAFVDQVRSGQNEIAKQNGITDMVWIAILDDRTDECCEWRNGLTSSEIEAKLEGEHSDDECDALVPPAHFNCRCSMAPFTADIGDVPESNLPEFDAWLNDQ